MAVAAGRNELGHEIGFFLLSPEVPNKVGLEKKVLEAEFGLIYFFSVASFRLELECRAWAKFQLSLSLVCAKFKPSFS